MVGRTAQSRTYCEIKFMICSTMFLHSKKRWITMISTRLQEIEPVYNKGQDTIIINRGSNQQAQGCQVLQQIGPYLEI